MILLIGTPRSGSTWFGKIFDSHPGTLYRHEPDSVLPAGGIPHLVPLDEVPRHREAVSRYLDTLARLGTVKTAGVAPAFPKTYSGPTARLARTALVTSLKVAETPRALRPLVSRIPVPDLASGSTSPRVVIKSVIGLGRARLYSEALAGGHLIILLRHPCAYVSSQLRGLAVKRMTGFAVSGEWPRSEPMRRRGLSKESMQALSDAERIACHWLAFNEKALEETADRPNTRIVLYEDLCRDPMTVARELFQWCDLEWHRQTEAFIESTTTVDHDPGYFELRRNTAADVDKWRRELDETTIDAILQRVKGSLPANLYGI